MKLVRKFEFFDDTTGKFHVVEETPKTSPKSIPNSNGRFVRTWIGEKGKYRGVIPPRNNDTPFIRTLCTKNGYLKIKKGEFV